MHCIKMSGKLPQRKRARSAKGQLLDDLKNKEKSPKAKQLKVTEKPKSKVSRRIVFNDDTDTNEQQVNNNG